MVPAAAEALLFVHVRPGRSGLAGAKGRLPAQRPSVPLLLLLLQVARADLAQDTFSSKVRVVMVLAVSLVGLADSALDFAVLPFLLVRPEGSSFSLSSELGNGIALRERAAEVTDEVLVELTLLGNRAFAALNRESTTLAEARLLCGPSTNTLNLDGRGRFQGACMPVAQHFDLLTLRRRTAWMPWRSWLLL